MSTFEERQDDANSSKVDKRSIECCENNLPLSSPWRGVSNYTASKIIAGIVDIRLHGKRNSKLPWRKAGQPSHLVDVVDSDR